MVIGFAGKAAAGKTTAARHLAPLLPGKAMIIPMAMVLRDEVEVFLRGIGADASVPLVYGSQEDKLKTFEVDEKRALEACPQWGDFIAGHAEIQNRPGKTVLTVRRILQWWGTEFRRAQDPDYWTKAWARKVAGYDLVRTHILIDDVRFKNELATIRDLGGKFVKIVRPGFNGAGNHASETSLDDYTAWDAVILNDGTLEQFLRKVATLTNLLG